MKRYILNSTVIALVFLLSCAKTEKISPDLSEVNGPVEFEEAFTVSTLNPNFANNEKVYFYAKFKTDAHWVLTVKGANSNSLKQFEGTGRFISPSNVMWDGTTDSLPSFRAETAVATLSFPDASSVPAITLSYNIVIAGTKNLNYGHVLVTDFNETPTKIRNIYDGNFSVVLPSEWASNYPQTDVHNDIPLKNPDGNKYCTMGNENAWQDNLDFPGHTSPYVDHMIITATSVGYPTYFPLIGNPEQIYFNIMIYNNPDLAPYKYTWLQVSLVEDHPTLAETFVAKSYNFYPKWKGWKLVSIPYREFKIGNGTLVLNNPQKIRGMQLTLLSNAPQDILDARTEDVVISFDHILFSHYKPYQP